jgi:hypothetical protein
MRTFAVVMVLAASFVFATPIPQVRFKLPSGCTLPFASIAPPTDSFAACDDSGRMTGVTPPSKAKQLQASAKNNLCAADSEVVLLHFEEFSSLENATDRTQLDLSKSRTDLTAVSTIHGTEVGEGTVVDVVAMMRSAHVSDCRTPRPGSKGGEAVNCNVLGVDKNDFHIVLMPIGSNDQTDECQSVTAEIIPHFRPSTWAQLDMKTPVANPVRVRGQLFYDDAHQGCQPGKPASPARRSVWEIHPVYQLDVCKGTTESACQATDANAWVPYDQWVTRPGIVTAATGKKARRACESAATR